MQALRIPPTAGLLLTGGSSRRLGEDKASLRIDGRTLAERAADVLVAACEPCLEVGPGHSGLPSIREAPAGSGPLAAVVAGAIELRARGFSGAAVVLAVDLPAIDVAILRRLVGGPPCDALVPVVRGRDQPLCARYSWRALELAEETWRAGGRAMRDLLAVLEVTRVDVAQWGEAEAEKFADVDTPADWERVRALARNEEPG